MGKKGKANKMAKMSEEERARYLQMRADIEEETRRRKIHLLSLYMKNKLKREEAFCRLNMAKINQEWRSILRQVKCQDLHNEILEVERFFKEQLERKMGTISRLLADLEMAEDMYATLQQSHMELVQKMIITQLQRVAHFKHIYEQERTAVLRECCEDFEDYRQMHARAWEQLECVYYQLEDRANKQSQANSERHLERVDDIKSTMELRLEEITCRGEEKLERLWKEYQDVLSGYVNHTEGFYAEYMELKERDEESSAIIRTHSNAIERATNQLAQLKLVAGDVEEKNDIKLSYLVNVRAELVTRFAELKQRVAKEMTVSGHRFTLLSVESYNALKGLGSIVKKGETLLQLAMACRRFETDREKLAPLGLPPLMRTVFVTTDEELKRAPPELKEASFANWRKMENFWRRVNNATIDVVCLKQQKRSLEDDNARLRKQLQEYLVALNLSNGCNMHVNDYLCKRPRSMCINRMEQVKLHHKKPQSAGEIARGRHSTALPLRPITAYVEANFTSTVRSRQLDKNKMQLAKIRSMVNW